MDRDALTRRSEGGPVTNLNTESWIQAARRYVKLRRLYWRNFLGLFAPCAAVGIPLAAWGDRMHAVPRGFLVALLMLGGFGCWLTSLATWFALITFRCPRCGNLFVLSWLSSWPANRCKTLRPRSPPGGEVECISRAKLHRSGNMRIAARRCAPARLGGAQEQRS
jgi:hypothetical protein